MESARMMKMATGEGSPLRQGAGTGSRLVFGGYRGLRRRNSRSRLCSGSLGIYKRCWRRGQVRGSPKRPRGRGRAQGCRARPHPRGCLGTLLAHLQYSVGFFWSKNNLHEISGQLDSVWFSFCAILKNKEKQKLALGSRLIGLSQKSYKIAYKCISNILDG